MRLAVWEGVLFALMFGISDTCLVAEVLRLGASPLEVALFTSLPLLCGGFGSVFVLRCLQWLPRRRSWVTAGAAGQALCLAALAAAVAAGRDSVPIAIAIACVYQACGQGAGTAWSSWYGDVVPRMLRGRYFARRTRIVQICAFASVLAGGAVLHWLEPGAGFGDATPGGDAPGGAGFAVVFAFAAVARAASSVVLALSPEPVFRGITVAPAAWLFQRHGSRRNAWRILLVGGLFHLGVYSAAPFFVPYVLAAPGIGYLGYVGTLAAAVVAKSVSLPWWGRIVDRRGARPVFRLAMVLSAWVPLPYLLTGDLTGLTLAAAFSGFAWGGYEVASFALMLDSSTRRTRPQLFAAQGLVNGTCQVGGSLAGAGLMGLGGYATVFAISLSVRMLIAIALPVVIRPVLARRPRRGSNLPLRLVGFRPHGGIVHRPVLDESGAPPTPRAPAVPALAEAGPPRA